VRIGKPADVFDRDEEWRVLSRFAGSRAPGAGLALVYGRRRQGKTYLLQALAEATGGFYAGCLRQSDLQNRDRLAALHQAFTGSPAPSRFDRWDDVFRMLLSTGRGGGAPSLVVLDEFPYLLDEAPHIPSLLQDLLSPRGEAVRSWPARLVLCGSALSTMQRLTGGTAPLRGRAALELVVRPFGYREAARFWDLDDPAAAFRLHALVGGTPGYRDMAGGAGPRGLRDLDRWVAAHLLEQSSAMFREGNVLLAEQDHLGDTALYFSVLRAVSEGKTRRGEIAAAMGRPESSLSHAIGTLVEMGLLAPLEDALRQRRTTYRLAEPVLRLQQLVVAPNEPRLVRGGGTALWGELAPTVASRIYGPHFEDLARTWCEQHAEPASLGGPPRSVVPTVVPCRTHRVGHQVDVVVLDKAGGRGANVLAISAQPRHPDPPRARSRPAGPRRGLPAARLLGRGLLGRARARLAPAGCRARRPRPSLPGRVIGQVAVLTVIAWVGATPRRVTRPSGPLA
jgi:AAA+ ATPase superfamily predicted ATPase